MYTTYHLNSNDLTTEFIDILKTTFKGKNIEITVFETDDTEYLLRSPANRDVLLQRIADVKNDYNIITPDIETLK